MLGGTGLLFRTGDAAALAAALSVLFDDPALALILGQRAPRRSIDFYDNSRMIEEHARLYKQMTAANKS